MTASVRFRPGDQERCCVGQGGGVWRLLSKRVPVLGLWLFVCGCQGSIPLSPPEPPEPELGRTETLIRDYPKPCAVMWEAAQAAVNSLGMNVLGSESVGPGGILTARRADGHTLDVDVAPIDPTHSQVTVRVQQGDRDLAWLVQQEILIRAGLG